MNSNPITETDIREYNKTFTYDAVERLTAMDGSGGGTFARTYSYDAVGNRTFGDAQGTVVMSLAGHAPQTTTDGYSHVKSEQKLRWMERYWATLQDASETSLFDKVGGA